jgi:hypothetical protein
MAPTANRATMIRVQRRASIKYSGSPVRRCSHSTNMIIGGKAMPKHTNGICTTNDSVFICRTSSR